MLGSLWSFGLDGIWLNFVGVTALAAALSAVMLRIVGMEIKRKEKELSDTAQK
jgi:hypothetical protein